MILDAHGSCAETRDTVLSDVTQKEKLNQNKQLLHLDSIEALNSIINYIDL